MKNPFRIGDTKTHTHLITPADLAAFGAGEVHPVYSTFAIGRDAEWACRLFVLDMLEPGEEGIGIFLHIDHHSPGLAGETAVITAELVRVTGREIVCRFEVYCGQRRVASGVQGQKIIDKARFQAYIGTLS